ncbi:MAG TPA: ABC transporter ATP-binding protein [Casimicrobiaceae bacterium]|nr:ABC transporter ATP-binding protein [Casimicrobiaceae bacterium]
MATVALDRVSKRFGEFPAVDDFSLDVAEGELLVLLGPSGCGKTTTLRLIAGFADASAGTVRIGGRDVTREPPYRRNVGVVFQNYALFPHLTVFENVAFGLRRRRQPETEIARRVERALALVKLETLAQRLPRQLSGGQQQRVALARALVIEPDVLLLDEPLSNLDAKLRHDVRQEMRRLQQLLKLTTIMVTHDQDEAMSMGDRLVVMASGRIQQIGSPQDLYMRPGNHFVASFIGQANFLEGRLDGDGSAFVTSSGLAIACARSAPDARILMIRPEAIELLDAPSSGQNVLRGTVEVVTYLGSTSELIVRLASNDIVTVTKASSPGSGSPRSFAAGQSLLMRIDPASAVGIVPA